jgi:predicted nucleotidyltransferase
MSSMKPNAPISLTELRERFKPFCQRHRVRRLEVFGSVARGQAAPVRDLDLLVTLEQPESVSTGELLEMAGEAEEIAGLPVDFVLRDAIERSPNRFARARILSSAVCIYGS